MATTVHQPTSTPAWARTRRPSTARESTSGSASRCTGTCVGCSCSGLDWVGAIWTGSLGACSGATCVFHCEHKYLITFNKWGLNEPLLKPSPAPVVPELPGQLQLPHV